VKAETRVFPIQLALGAAGLSGAALTLAVAVSTVHVSRAAAHRLAVAGLHFTYPAVNAAAACLLAFAVLGAAVLIVTVRSIAQQVRGHRRLLRTLEVDRTLPGQAAVRVIAAGAPVAFCAGWLRPNIYISTAAVERLSEAELRAVLAHEQEHRRMRDPLRLAVGRVLCQALFFLPVLQRLHARYGDVAELAADAAAVTAADGSPAPLAAAMLAFDAAAERDDAVGISPDRIDSLLGCPPDWRLPWALLTIGFVTVAAVLAIVWRASANASIQATLNLPVATSAPCILVLALIPVLAGLAGVLARPR
jgi:Zn-dependent protease with chaperone function